MRVKIADFGLSKRRGDAAAIGHGTPPYMVTPKSSPQKLNEIVARRVEAAVPRVCVCPQFVLCLLPNPPRLEKAPELLDDASDAGALNLLSIDVYALGITLWQLWHKRAPYPRLSVARMTAYVLAGKRPAFGALDDDVPPPPPLAALIAACWHQDPAQRPTVDEAFDKFRGAAAVVAAAPAVIAAPPAPPAVPAALKSPGAGATASHDDDDDDDDDARAEWARKPRLSAAVRAVLRAAGLEPYAAPLASAGLTDWDMFSGAGIADDAALVAVGMTLPETRRLRFHVAKRARLLPGGTSGGGGGGGSKAQAESPGQPVEAQVGATDPNAARA
jgi:serine/threonine protein kinase